MTPPWPNTKNMSVPSVSGRLLKPGDFRQEQCRGQALTTGKDYIPKCFAASRSHGFTTISGSDPRFSTSCACWAFHTAGACSNDQEGGQSCMVIYPTCNDGKYSPHNDKTSVNLQSKLLVVAPCSMQAATAKESCENWFLAYGTLWISCFADSQPSWSPVLEAAASVAAIVQRSS